MTDIICGIDPGSDGFFTFRKGDKLTFYRMPHKKDGSLDGGAMSVMFYDELNECFTGNATCKIFIEEVHALGSKSAAATFTFGANVGFIHGVMGALWLEYEFVQPKKWQSVIWIDEDIVKVPSKSGKKIVKDTKATSINAAHRLFPEVDLRISKRARNDHDGKADSLLICEYGRRKLLKD